MDLEKQIRELQRELAEVQRERAALRLQPCRGDSEIRKKDEKLEELDKRAKIVEVTLRDQTRKRQLSISQSTSRGIYDVHPPEKGPHGTESSNGEGD